MRYWVIALIAWLIAVVALADQSWDKSQDDDLHQKIISQSPTLYLSPDDPVEIEPLVHYKLEDSAAATSIADASGNFAGTATRNASVFCNVAAKISNGCDFYTGSVEDAINVGNLGGLTDFSFAVWMYADGWGGSSTGRLFDVDTNTPYFAVNGTNPHLLFSNGSDNVVSADNSIAVTTWTHVALTRSGSVCQFYLNGAAVATTGTCPANTLTTTRIGNRNGGARWFDGKLDDVRIYNRVLSPQEVANIYRNGTGHQNQATSNTQGAIVVDSANRVGAWQSKVGGIEFTQATDGNKPYLTRGDSAENRALQSDAISTSPWANQRATLSATGFLETAVLGTHDAYQLNIPGVIAGQTYKISAVVSGVGGRNAAIGDGTIEYGCDLTTLAKDYGVGTGSCENAGGGKVRITLNSAGATNSIYIYSTTGGAVSFNGDITKGLNIANVQYRPVDTSPLYIPTTTYPIYSGLNGRRVVRFDGVDDQLISTANISTWLNTKTKSFIGITRPATIAGTDKYVFRSTGGGYLGLAAGSSNFIQVNNDGGAKNLSIAGANVPTVFSYSQDGTLASGRINGVTGTPIANGANADLARTMAIGSASGSSYWDSIVGPIVMWSKTLAPDVFLPIERGLAQKYGVSLASATSETDCSKFISSLTPTLWLDSSDLSSITKDGSNKVSGWWNRADAYGGRENLLTYSEDPSQAAWDKASYPVTWGAPTITATATNASHALRHNTGAALAAGTSYTVVIDVAYNNYRFLGVGMSGDAAWHWLPIDLQTGAVGAGTNATGSIETVSPGRYKITMVFTATNAFTAAPRIAFGSAINDTSPPTINAAGTEKFDFYSIQLRSTYESPSTYVQTVASAINNIGFGQGTAANQPTWTGDGVQFVKANSQDMRSTNTLDDIFNNNAKTAFIAFKAGDCSVTSCSLLRTSTDWGIQILNTGTVFRAFNGDGATDVTAGNAVAVGSLYVGESTHDGVNLISKLNGAADSSIASGATSTMTNPLVLGSTTVAEYTNGTIMALITDDSVWTADQRARVRSCLGQKFGVSF